MATYEWTQTAREEVVSPGSPGSWWTPESPFLPLSLFSPDENDWRLVRLEASANIGICVANEPFFAPDPGQPVYLNTRILAEVYPYGSTDFPDPTADGVVRAVWSAVLSPCGVSYDNATDVRYGADYFYSTNGLVTSQGQRGPDDYGGGRAQINFGLWTANCYNAFWPGAAGAGFTMFARALWKR